MRFSLILSTMGRVDEVGRFLDSLLRQGPIAADCEVLLVDQNGDDRLAPIVATYEGRLTLRHLRTATRGLSRGRNVGLAVAAGELIGFPDDDCEYTPGVLDRVAQAFDANPTLDGITGMPTADRAAVVADDWRAGAMPLDRVGVMNRCQEFTIFIRSSSLGAVRFNPLLGVGAGTPWGSDEGPDFLVRLVDGGRHLLHLPQLLVYHPNKIATFTRGTIARAASYARGRGAFFSIHHYPLPVIARSLFRPAVGAVLYLLLLRPMRSRYYAAVATQMARGLCLSRADLATLTAAADSIETAMPAVDPVPVPLPPLQQRPLVSVLITSFNYSRFLPASLDAVLAQSYDRLQIIVCDDGSTDDSAAVARRYAARDPRVVLILKPNGGQTSAVNAAVAAATGDIACLLDADDVFAPDKVRRVVDAFAADPAAGACYHHARAIDAAGNHMLDRVTPHLESGWHAADAADRGGCAFVPTTSCMSFRREALAAMTPVPPELPNDTDGYFGMAGQFLTPAHVIDATLTDYRVHGDNMGGLTEPTPKRLGKELWLIARRTGVLRSFLTARFGPALAERIQVRDNPQYIQAALKLHAIDPAHAELRGQRSGELIARHPNAKWRAFWHALFLAPPPVRRWAIPALHRSHRLKAIVHKLVKRPTPPEPSGSAAGSASTPPTSSFTNEPAAEPVGSDVGERGRPAKAPAWTEPGVAVR